MPRWRPAYDGLLYAQAEESDVRSERRGRDVFGDIDVLYLWTLATFWLLNLADLVLTVIWTGGAGWEAEANVLLRTVADRAGTFGFVVYKLALASIVAYALWWFHRRVQVASRAARARRQRVALLTAERLVVAATWLLVAFFVWVVWNNMRVVGFL